MNTLTGPYGWFRQTALRHRDLTALQVAGHQLSYGELDEAATLLAAEIVRAAGGRPRAVGLSCARSVAAYAGYLAASRTGAAVVPLSPVAPASRNGMICQAAGTEVIIIDDSGGQQPAGTGAATLRLTGSRWWSDRRPGQRDPASAEPRFLPDDVAYVLFTSGSTGRPKGVPIRHRQLADYVTFCAQRYGVGPGSRLSQTFELTFDLSVFDMLVAWSTGATLVVPRPEELLTPASFVTRNGITHWFSVPSVISLARRLHGLRPGSMPGLRWSLFCGEQLTLDQARAWSAAAPASVVENLYGPTELTVSCTCYRLPGQQDLWPRTSNGTVPIGRPNPHLETLMLGEGGREGELCVRGSQRFDGYLDPADNTNRFLTADGQDRTGVPGAQDWYRTGDRVRWEDGELVHLGRIDEQLKISGHRVEPGEIESVLRDHPGVLDAVVLAVADGGAEAVLHALYTGEPTLEEDLAGRVRRRLPGYMVPRHVHHLPEFPLNPNGKIDRSRLRHALTGNPTQRRSDAIVLPDRNDPGGLVAGQHGPSAGGAVRLR
jgi:amino acid adenylation domain-containing protein